MTKQYDAEHGVHVTMLHRWKNTAVDNLSAFSRTKSRRTPD
ncbi:hypothetical protein [Alicyclobacillus suci]|nr:hypothetical protein [Alicyclobacillus suci]